MPLWRLLASRLHGVLLSSGRALTVGNPATFVGEWHIRLLVIALVRHQPLTHRSINQLAHTSCKTTGCCGAEQVRLGGRRHGNRQSADQLRTVPVPDIGPHRAACLVTTVLFPSSVPFFQVIDRLYVRDISKLPLGSMFMYVCKEARHAYICKIVEWRETTIGRIMFARCIFT